MMTETIAELISAVRLETDRAEFPIDEPVYTRWGRDPKEPIFYAGSLEAPLCIVGRDLGKDEVRNGQPLIGAAGRLVRLGILKAFDDPAAAGIITPSHAPLQEALKYALLTNTVPYKPPGNKSYPEGVRTRFRPLLEQLLGQHWQGDQIITLGREAFQWFKPYANPDEWASLGGSDSKFEAAFHCHLPAGSRRGSRGKAILVHPLPHPSPLNRRWFPPFPEMLASRLEDIRHRLPKSPKK